MQLPDVILFASVFCASAVLGAVLGFLCRGRFILTVVLSLIASIVFFAMLEWKLGSPGEWSSEYPIVSSAYLAAPFGVLVLGPTLMAAVFVTRWWMRRKTI
jgi:hypothetical protein